jgi:ribosome-binding factor A
MPRPKTSRAAAGKTTHRVDRVSSLIQQIVAAAMLPYVRNCDGIVTVSRVTCSHDLRWAKIFITVVGGGDGADAQAMGTLKNNVYEIQGELNRTLAMKLVPRITFLLDTTARHAEHISGLFQKIREEDSDRNMDAA